MSALLQGECQHRAPTPSGHVVGPSVNHSNSAFPWEQDNDQRGSGPGDSAQPLPSQESSALATLKGSSFLRGTESEPGMRKSMREGTMMEVKLQGEQHLPSRGGLGGLAVHTASTISLDLWQACTLLSAHLLASSRSHACCISCTSFWQRPGLCVVLGEALKRRGLQSPASTFSGVYLCMCHSVSHTPNVCHTSTVSVIQMI